MKKLEGYILQYLYYNLVNYLIKTFATMKFSLKVFSSFFKGKAKFIISFANVITCIIFSTNNKTV